MEVVILAICILALTASIIVPLVTYRRAIQHWQQALSVLAEKLEAIAESPAKMLEVREFHAQMMEMVEAVLSEARKRKDRRLLEQALRMRERLEVLKARVLDKTLRLVEEGAAAGERRRSR